MYPYFDKLFPKFQCGFRKGFNVEHCLITMIEKWRRSVDGGGQVGALVTDLSKAFDCIEQNFMLTVLIKIPCTLLIRICKDGNKEPK